MSRRSNIKGEKKSILMRMKTKSFLLFHALSHLSFGAKGLDDPNQPLRHQLPFSPPPLLLEGAKLPN